MLLDHSTDGHPIILDESTGEIVYKDTRVAFQAIKDAFESGMDRVKLSEKLEIIITDGWVTFGCLTLTKQKVNQLIKLSWKQLKTYN